MIASVSRSDAAAVAGEGYPGTACPGCGGTSTNVFYEVRNVPAHSVLLMSTREAAIGYRRGDIALSFCETCGFIFNSRFDPGLHEYSDRYEETQAFSGIFNDFHRALAGRLVERHSLYGKAIIEIGCGKGEFLSLLCELGNNRGLGFDPSYVSERNNSVAKDRLTVVTDFYSEKYADCKAQFLCCKMTLEHIPDTGRFIGMVRRVAGDDPETVVFFQVPNVTRILRDVAFWDIYYEHCSYFTAASLCHLFRQNRFEILDVREEYDGQYLAIEARPTDNRASDARAEAADDLARDVAHFRSQVQACLSGWKRRLQKIKEAGSRAVLWGGGSKGVSFLTTLEIQDEIQYAVDINPYKRGTYMAGTGHQIVGPQFLAAYKPDVIILMNPVYRREVQGELTRLRIQPQILTL